MLVKNKLKKVYKHNNLNQANFGNFNLNDYRVYLNLLALIGGEYKNGEYIPNKILREYTLSAREFSKHFEVATNHSYEILKSAIDKLMGTYIIIELPKINIVRRINVCALADYVKTEGIIKVRFTEEIMDYLKEQAINYTVYNLKEISHLNSIYAIRLYELIQQFKKTCLLNYTIDEWRTLFAIGKTQHKLYGNLKSDVFKVAFNEITTKTHYNLTMEEKKDGKKVVRVIFHFEEKEVTT